MAAIGVLWSLLHPWQGNAAPLPAAYVAVAAPGPRVCQGGVEQPGPPWYFEGPQLEAEAGEAGTGGKAGTAESTATATAVCAGGAPALSPEEALKHLGRPLPALYPGLHPDGRVLAVEVTVAVRHGGKLLLGARAPCPAAARGAPAGGADGGDAPGTGGAPDGGAPDGGDGRPLSRCREGDARGRPLALLPQKDGEVAAPVLLDPRVLPGSVRRMIGRKSLAARGRFVGEGLSVAAVFKLRGQAVQLAVFGDSGGLRLHQSVRWRSGRGQSAKPAALFTVPGLAGPGPGPGQDGLLLIGEGDDGAVPLLIQFDGKSLRTYP